MIGMSLKLGQKAQVGSSGEIRGLETMDEDIQSKATISFGMTWLTCHYTPPLFAASK
jgi:hypothetical protein